MALKLGAVLVWMTARIVLMAVSSFFYFEEGKLVNYQLTDIMPTALSTFLTLAIFAWAIFIVLGQLSS